MTSIGTAARIEAARHDPVELGRIADELQHMPGADAARLRLRAVMLRRQARMAEQSAVPVPAWLAELGLPAIDGRPLHRFRLSDEGFCRLEYVLRAQTASLRFAPDPIAAARFVLWAAEWFRRHYDGRVQRWARSSGSMPNSNNGGGWPTRA